MVIYESRKVKMVGTAHLSREQCFITDILKNTLHMMKIKSRPTFSCFYSSSLLYRQCFLSLSSSIALRYGITFRFIESSIYFSSIMSCLCLEWGCLFSTSSFFFFFVLHYTESSFSSYLFICLLYSRFLTAIYFVYISI